MDKIYKISVDGCDDSTEFEIELKEQEYETIKKVADKCNETSTYSCQPRINIEAQ